MPSADKRKATAVTIAKKRHDGCGFFITFWLWRVEIPWILVKFAIEKTDRYNSQSNQTVSSNQDFMQDVSRCVEVMRRGGVVVYPTDTVWGIGCDARNSSAVRRVFEIKRRAESKALISLVADRAMLGGCVGEIPPAVIELLENQGSPLTVVYDHPSGLAPELLAQDGSAALRITSEPYSQALCRELGAPVVSTSANVAGNPTPLSFRMIDPYILESADYVSLYGRDFPEAAGASRVIKVSADGQIKIIRP